MGVDVDAMHIYGYKVGFDDIPDARDRFENSFNDVADEPDGWKVTICGDEVWCEELAIGGNSYANYDEQSYYIGINLPDESDLDELAQICVDANEKVGRMYELVMRKPPTEKPKIHVFARWW